MEDQDHRSRKRNHQEIIKDGSELLFREDQRSYSALEE